MAKHDGRRSRRQPPTSRSVSMQVALSVLGVLRDVRQAFQGLCISTGLQGLQAMMEDDGDAVCGPEGAAPSRTDGVAGRQRGEPRHARRPPGIGTPTPRREC